MADKEERILIARSSDYTLTDTDKGELFEGKIAPHCANVFTRQDAIERMTVAMCKFDCIDIERECENCNEWEKYDKCESLAEAALNALLEGHDGER